MKSFSAVLCFAVLLLGACKKNNDNSPNDYSSVKITAISDIPPFKYQGDRLVAIGNETFTYDNSGRIISSRIEHSDTVNNIISGYIYKSTYTWTGNICSGSIADSLYTFSKTTTGKGVDSEHFENGNVLSSYGYNYVTSRLDSLTFMPGKWNTAYYTSVKFEYDAKGNISKAIAYVRDFVSTPGIPREIVVKITYQYDNHPNPFYAMYKKYGMVLPALQRFADLVSPNNVIKMNIAIGNTIELVQQYSYEYNHAGYPVKIVTNGGNITGQTTYISYE
ncbi:hypothetical protein [Chitinophaga flava]|uniref:DUF4595 domain-containing protein n=1 Tax=Chitinophaga flava TaxID=2259036 RepID=A0A365Y2F5_9BACT|nr:hypothetical protein [Chitinophaga flava]RBL92783.1 hypothetical protein DF182_09450 [Chitinophaga flava]